MKIPLLFASIIYFLAVLSGCSQNSGWKKERSELLRRAAALERRHCLLKASIDSLWDVTSARLDRALPAGFPDQDRKTFLNARNADHIRMFQSFKQLDADTQSLVDQAGQYDALLAAQVRDLMEERQVFERQKIRFLQQVEHQDTAASRIYTRELLAATTATCQ